MRIKLLLFLLLFTGGLVSAQDTIKTLLITEAHLGTPGRNFVEITNMGSEAVQLSEFELGRSRQDDFDEGDNTRMMLPDKLLQPGESFFVAVVNDYGLYVYNNGIGEEGFGIGPVLTPVEMWELADIQIHQTNISGELANAELDSVSPIDPIGMYFGRQSVYLRQYLSNGDSVVVDQVMGVFDEPYGDEGGLQNKAMSAEVDGYDVAGFTAAGNYATLVRKFAVKQGNIEFVRGTDEANSEWIALPNISGMAYRMQPWTYKNHGDYNLDENTLVSDVADVDFAGKTITVPWGTLRPDGVMKLMDKKPGVFWSYIFSENPEDSLSFACRTGDRLAIVVCGNDADRDTFDIVVSDPTDSDNFVVPVPNWDPNAVFANEIMGAYVYAYPRIVEGADGAPDTLSGRGWIFNTGVPNALRVDSLLEKLAFPANATWEIIPVDDNATRPDLLDGDILKVTAANDDVKEYYIKVKSYDGAHDARLASITWPDMPEIDKSLYQESYGWSGDTVPSFLPNTFNYQLKLPPWQESTPATVAKKYDENAKVEVSKATNLQSFKDEDRTTVYTVTAEDDTTIQEYRLEWQKEFNQDDVQPYQAEPFVSEHIMRYYFGNDLMEICNPGNQVLDLSDYMIVGAPTANPADAIQFTGEWDNRFRKYVPGYKWVDSVQWAITPGVLVEDLAVDPLVEPGDVFTLAEMSTTAWWGYGQTGWTDSTQIGVVETDVQFYNVGWANNPWGEDVPDGEVPIAQADAGEIQFIFKILNDSVKEGLKPATDPQDFDLIETMGNVDLSAWMFGYEATEDGHNFATFIRKPEFVFPKADLEESFGDTTTGAPSEWHRITRFSPEGVGGWPEQWILTAMLDYGRHYFIPTTAYLSKVSSNLYQVSPGYQIEDIKGLVSGVTVSDFLASIDKADEDQTLVVKSGSDGADLGSTDEISASDTLVVTSANGENVTKYVLDVTAEGLSSDALITSDEYTVTVDEDPASGNEFVGVGSLSGFDYGTTLKTVLENIDLPAGAKLTILDGNGHFVTVNRLNYDTVYVDATVNSNTMLQVVAEDMVTTINYWLKPGDGDEAIVTSDLLGVDQDARLINLIPQGVSVASLFEKLTPSTGATMKVVDKSGLERPVGIVRYDDKLEVTSESGENTNIYFLEFIGVPSVSLYVLSSVYNVDQFLFVINEVAETTDAVAFLNNLEASTGATLTLLDVDGNVKTSGAISIEDIVKVTAENGVDEISYTIGELVSVGDPLSADRINMYPNPTNGQLNITGLNVGERIQVFNITGAEIRNIQAISNVVNISLEEQPSGMYIIVVSDNDKLIGRYKAIRR